MYVIKVTNNSGALVGDVGDGSTKYFPADRCTWQITESTGGGYHIGDTKFYPGNAAAVDYGVDNVDQTFGYIGKTGRFVALTNPSDGDS